MSSRKNGISAKELQRILGFGSYETAWTWLHKLRRCSRRQGRDPLDEDVVADESYVGGTTRTRGRGTGKALILIAAEKRGRTRLEHAHGFQESDIIGFIHRNIAPSATITTDSMQSYTKKAMGPRTHIRLNLKQHNLKAGDPLQQCHRIASLLKRWLLGTYHGAVSRKHLSAYLDEFSFRFNRRKTRGVGRVAARLLQQAATVPPIPYATIVNSPVTAQFGQT